MASAGTIEVDIRANSAQFVRSMDKVRKNTQRTANELRTFRRFATAAFAALGGTGLARQVLRTADSIEQFSRRINVNARELQAWQQVALRFNVTQQQFDMGLQRVTRRAQEAAQGTGEARAALQTLGVDAGKFVRLGLDEQMLELARAFEQAGNENQQLALAFKLFDSEGAVFLQFLREGEKQLEKLREGTRTWSDEERKALADSQTEWALWADKVILETGRVLASLRTTTAAQIRELGAAGAFGTPQGLARSSFAPVGGSVLPPGGGVLLSGFGVMAPGGGPTEPPPRPRAAPGISPSLSIGPQTGFAEFLNVLEGESAFAALDQLVEANQQAAQESAEAWKRFSGSFEQLFAQNMVQAAEGGFDQILQSWILTLQQMVAQLLASKIFEFLGGTGVGGALAGAFGGARADGGPVQAGKAFLVGERGPEMFVPNSSGNIIPNGAGGAVINQQINVSGGANRAELVAAMNIAKEQTKAEVMDLLRRRGR